MILSVDGQAVRSMADVDESSPATAPATAIAVELSRDGSRLTVQVQLGEPAPPRYRSSP